VFLNKRNSSRKKYTRDLDLLNDRYLGTIRIEEFTIVWFPAGLMACLLQKEGSQFPESLRLFA